MKPKTHYMAAISAFVVWGFIALPLKQLNGYASTQILYYRILLALLCLPFLLILFKRTSLLETYEQIRHNSRKENRLFVTCTLLGTVFLTVNWLLFIYVVNHINIQTASFSYLICPIITALLGFVVLKEKLKSQQWLAIGLSLGSCCLLGVDSVRNLLFSLLVAFTYAFYLITQRLLKKYDKIVLLGMQIALSFAVIASFGEPFRGSLPVDLRFYTMVFILSTVFTILPLFLNLYALKELPSATIGILMYINPLINFAVAFLYFGEKASSTQLTAYLLILVSVVIYNFNFKYLTSLSSASRNKVPS